MGLLETLVTAVFMVTFAFVIIRRRQRKPPLPRAEITKPEWWGADLNPPGLGKHESQHHDHDHD